MSELEQHIRYVFDRYVPAEIRKEGQVKSCRIIYYKPKEGFVKIMLEPDIWGHRIVISMEEENVFLEEAILPDADYDGTPQCNCLWF